jgi:3-phosphoshikimate 1-carboxyvinyltransferase
VTVAVRVEPARALRGVIVAPPDKSISHRAALFAAIATGDSRVHNFLTGDDCLSTLACLRGLGVEWALEQDEGGATLLVSGRGLDGLREPEDVLDCGNSGTTMRLLAGLLAGRQFLSVLTGDQSLRSRPMGRVAEPLRQKGALIWGRGGGSLAPLVIHGSELWASVSELEVASAQVKSALILAGLQSPGESMVVSPGPSRDHTERMLQAMGAELTFDEVSVTVSGLAGALAPLDLRVPGDISSVAPWLVAASAHGDAEVLVTGVGVNPTRTGLIDILRAMGARLELQEERTVAGEPVADILVQSAPLRGTTVDGSLVPRSIDELPVVALAACYAEGDTVIRGASELRVKESDRVATTVEALNSLGGNVEALDDGLVVSGPCPLRGGDADSRGDHRLAALLGVAGLLSREGVTVGGDEAVTVSYPGFWQDLEALRS